MTQANPDQPGRDFWSRYWQSGSATSLPQDFRANYDGEIEAFWRAQLLALPESASVLDVCTGNGPVALLMAGIARGTGRSLNITAIDAADINPSRAWQGDPESAALLGQIRFLGGHALENSHLPDAGFDLITSQFGIEYCNWQAAAAQVWRLLKPGGCLALICHISGSDILRTMNDEAEAYAQVDQLGVAALLREAAAGQVGARELQQRLNQVGPQLVQLHRQGGAPLIAGVLDLLQQVARGGTGWLHAQAGQVQVWLQQMADGRARLEDMLRVYRAINLAGDNGGHWTEVFLEAGLEPVSRDALYYNGSHHVGDACVMRKPG